MQISSLDEFNSSILLDHHVPEMRHEHGRRLWFDISEIGEEVTLMMAELRLYQNSMFSKFDEEKPLTISVYLVEARDEENHEVLRLLSSKNTTTHSDGWLELNVTQALQYWTEENEANLGLTIKASLNERPEKELKLEDFGLVNSKGDDESQPFMVGFFKGQEVRLKIQSIEVSSLTCVFR
jgi:bone morphogenetic protein 7